MSSPPPAVSTVPPTSTPIVSATAAAVDPATVDPCSLLDAAQIGAALGETVSAGVLTESAEHATCFYDVAAWPVPIVIPEDSGVRLVVSRDRWTVSTYRPADNNPEQQPLTEISGVGDRAWWQVHVELPNIHVNTENANLYVVSEPFQFTISFIQIPNPVGVDKGEWLADATALANEVIAALGR